MCAWSLTKKGGSFDDFLNEEATLIVDNVARC